jgi:aconitate hydratase
MVGRNGALADIVSAGARVLESACGFCIGNSQAPKTNAVSVRTNNRNFYGRTGTVSAGVYLVSPEAAVAAALSGKISDPVRYFASEPYEEIPQPKKFFIDDSLIVEPSDAPETVEIFRGPNIGGPPQSDACPQAIDGEVTILLGDKVTTDHIMPAGSRLKYRSNIPEYAKYVFERNDPQFAAKSLANKAKGVHSIIVAGESYGQGSSREHAAICPMYLGVKMVLAKSIERIHMANLINFGIVPAIFKNSSDYGALKAGDRIKVENLHEQLNKGSLLTIQNVTSGASFSAVVELSDRQRRILLAGGLINATKAGR